MFMIASIDSSSNCPRLHQNLDTFKNRLSNFVNLFILSNFIIN